MIRPTFKAVVCFSLTVPAALALTALLPDFWFLAVYPPVIILALIGADMVMLLPGRRLEVEIRCPARLYIGRKGLASLSVTVDGAHRPVRIEALMEQSGEAEPPEAAGGLLTGGRLELAAAVVPLRRGLVELEAYWLRWRGPLGLIEARRRSPVGRTIEVVPDVQGIHETAIQFFAHDAAFGLKTQRRRGEGSEFDNLCEYAQGMDSRFIDWKRSASHRKLLCKEFRQERNHEIVFGFDAGHLMLEPIDGVPKLDHAIKAGLLLGWISLYSGDLVGGCAFDGRFRSFIKPGRGMPYFSQLQKFTAALDYRTEETNFTLGLAELNSRLKRRSLVVLFTEFVDAVAAEMLIESLQVMTRRHVVVFVSMRDPLLAGLKAAPPASFAHIAEAVIADSFVRERAVVLERVARLGVHCLDVPAAGVSSALLNRYLMIKQRGLL